MSWQGVSGHDDVVEQFRRRLAAGRVNGTFLFVGPPGVGKRMTAERLAAALLCRQGANPSLDPCGACEDCRLTTACNHPDLLIVEKPADKSEIPIKLLIGEGDTRMREGLCHDIGMKPFRGGRRVAIIDDADDLNTEGANCLLKTLEEPPPRSVMILISQSLDRQLPTIRSRSQLIRFQPLGDDVLTRLIEDSGLAAGEESRRLAAAADGSLERARVLADPAVVEYRADLHSRLDDQGWNATGEARALQAFAEAAGKEAAPRRRRLRIALGLMAEYYRDRIRRAAETEGGPNAGSGLEQLADVVDRCLAAIDHVDRNAHPTAVVEAVCDEVGKLLAA
jgi:DNA polymerase III subunit delta'